MENEKKKNSGSDYKYLALKPETYERLTRLMPGKRHYDNLINLTIDAYVMSGGVYGAGAGGNLINTEIGEIIEYEFKPEQYVKIMLHYDRFGVERVYFNLPDINLCLAFGKRLEAYITNKPDDYSFCIVSPSSDIWIDVRGIHKLVSEYKTNIPKANRPAVFRDVYTLLCWCEQFRPASKALEIHTGDEVF